MKKVKDKLFMNGLTFWSIPILWNVPVNEQADVAAYFCENTTKEMWTRVVMLMRYRGTGSLERFFAMIKSGM